MHAIHKQENITSLETKFYRAITLPFQVDDFNFFDPTATEKKRNKRKLKQFRTRYLNTDVPKFLNPKNNSSM